MNQIKITKVDESNVDDLGLYCVKDKKSIGYKKKLEWFKSELKNGLNLCIALNEKQEQLGFIEFIDSENAWRPINAKNYYFIQCIMVYGKKTRNQDIGSSLIRYCENKAKENNKSGICTISSKGPWLAADQLFVKNNFIEANKSDRFEIMYKELISNSEKPLFNDWEKQQSKYQGWNLLYADQCPWHEKSALDIQESAQKNKIDITVNKITTPKEAQNGPSGYGTFALLKDGKILADHYISRTRFENILKKELK